MATNDPGTPGELVIYPGKDGRLRVQARLAVDTLWLTQKQMAELFGVQPPAINKHLKNPPVAGSAVPDHFAEMLERVRDIRASERRMYLRVREVFTLAADYQPSLPETTRFFQIMQNKLHYAITGLTAPEIVASRINHALPHAGSVRKGLNG